MAEPLKSEPESLPEAAGGAKETEKAQSPAPMPMQILVRGGTTTTAYDMELKRRVADAEKRRAQLDRARRLASIPIEQGGALLHSHRFSDPLTEPRVVVRYVNEKKETIFDILCDLHVDDTSGAYILQCVCPECFRRGVHSGEAQMTVRDTNRKWYVDTKHAGEMRHCEDVDMDGNKVKVPYRHAGEIMDSESFTCTNYNCGATYKIHRNMMYRYFAGRR